VRVRVRRCGNFLSVISSSSSAGSTCCCNAPD
jgi:hypothetical protein